MIVLGELQVLGTLLQPLHYTPFPILCLRGSGHVWLMGFFPLLVVWYASVAERAAVTAVQY